MKYTFETDCAACSFEEFANRHGLELVVHERVLDAGLLRRKVERYYANFRDVDVKRGSILLGMSGNGNTPDEAIKDYAGILLGKRLVYRASNPQRRRDFVAPNAWK